MTDGETLLATLGIIVLILLLIIFAPLLFLWGLNTLFPTLAIPYTFKTWLAAALLGSIINTPINFFCGGKE